METLSSVLRLVTPMTYMAEIDIKDAYYSVPIKLEDQKLLKFKFDNVLYQFTSLPNGYSEGPRKFTKLLKTPLAALRMAPTDPLINFLMAAKNPYNWASSHATFPKKYLGTF